MPELPEVETIKRGLAKVILNKKITDFEKRDPKVVQFEGKAVESAKIKEIERRAKMLVFGLDNGKSILTHLKMTGQLIWRKTTNYPPSTTGQVAGGHPSPDWVAKLPNAYTRAIFHFNDDSVLFFNDLRRFGYMKLYDSKDLGEIKELKKLGPEPFSKDFTVEYLMRRAAKTPNRKIKQFITDQEIISGVGNIYVDEALFHAKISPLRPVKEIKLSEWQRIKDSVIKALELGIQYGGSSEDTYVDAFGNQGTMNDHTKVYRHTGADCPNKCGGTIKRITIAGRGTHFCPTCQK